MFFEGDLGVLDRLLEKHRLMQLDDRAHEEFRPWLAGSGGALCGTYCAGQLAALFNFGLRNIFTGAITSSTSTPAVKFFGDGNLPLARSIYWKECTLERFLSLRRLALWLAGVGNVPAMDIDFLCEVFRGKNDRGVCFDRAALREWPTAFYAATTKEDGTAGFLDMRFLEDPVEGTKASIAIPGFTRGYVRIDNTIHFDGDGAVPFPATEVLKFSPTDILVLANRPKPTKGKEVEADRPIPSAYLKSVPEGIREAFSTKHLRFAEGLKQLREQNTCRYLILWTDGEVGPFDRNSAKLEAASLRAEVHLNGLLSAAQERRRVCLAA